MAKRIDLPELYRTDPHKACRLALRRARRATAGQRGNQTDSILSAVSDFIGGYGIEAISGDDWVSYYLDIAALYVNVGETYACTVLYEVRTGRFLVTSYGDWIENEEWHGRMVQ